MTIRKRLLTLLLPPLIFFLIAISSFFYIKWSEQIFSGFQTQLRSVVITAAQTFTEAQIASIDPEKTEKNMSSPAVFQELQTALLKIRQQLPITRLSLVKLEKVPIGEPINPEEPIHFENPVYEGDDESLSFRKIHLLETKRLKQSKKNPSFQKKYDFATSLEKQVYQTKEAKVTKPYFSSENNATLVSAYAPILDDEGNVLALIIADASLTSIEKEKQRALLIMTLASLITIFLMTLFVSSVANSLSKPVRRLNAAALAIAAGEYGEQIQPEGPKEVKELSNTLNTLSQCLDETMARLQENSMARERMYGEYECSLLLQYYMLGKVISEFSSPYLSIELIKSSAGIPTKGLYLETQYENNETPKFIFEEADKAGFESIFQLQTKQKRGKKFSQISLQFDFTKSSLLIESTHFPLPFLWKGEKEKIEEITPGKHNFTKKDYLFVVNSSFVQQFSSTSQIEKWFSKVLRHFAREGLQLFSSMLRNELQFLMKKKPLVEDLNIICFAHKIETKIEAIPFQEEEIQALTGSDT